MKVTRRSLAGMLAAAAAGTAAAQATKQNPAAPAKPKPDATQDLESARQDLRNNALQISRIALPMSTEPAFRFRP